MSTNTACLNCKQTLHDKFCSHCGQKADTHRFSLKHIFSHDMIHSLFHLDKGFLYTLRNLFTRPGHSVRAYIQGERVNHFNYFTLLVVLLGVQHLLMPHSYEQAAQQLKDADVQQSMRIITDFTARNPKISMYFIPLISVFSLLWFRRAKQNFAEHMVLNAYRMGAEITIGIIFMALSYPVKNPAALNVINTVMALIVMVYGIWFYIQYFSAYGYSRAGLVLRGVLTVLSIPLFAMLLIGMLILLRMKGVIH